MGITGLVDLFAGCLVFLASAVAFHISLEWEWDRQRELSPTRAVAAIGVAAAVVGRARRRRSLSSSGQIAAFLTGIILTLSSTIHMVLLLVFFFSASRLTRFRQETKVSIYGSAAVSGEGERNWRQVVANGGPAVAASLLSLLASGFGAQRTLDFSPTQFTFKYAGTGLDLALAGGIAAAAGDSFASELGAVLSSGPPRLITTGRIVPRGTNGGVSFVGGLASLLGGLSVGGSHLALVLLLTEASLETQWPLMLIGALCGLLGSTTDSLLGATFQFSGVEEKSGIVVEESGVGVKRISGCEVLDNDAVNLLSVSLTALLAPRLSFGLCSFLRADIRYH